MNFCTTFPNQGSRFPRAVAAALLTALAALATGCGKNEAKSEDANVRILNLAPESGALSVVVADRTTNLVSGVAYKATSGFNTVPNGSQRIRISNSGGVILDTSIGFQGQKKQTLVVFGGRSSLGANVLLNDIPTSAQGKSRLRLASVAVGLGTYDLYMTTASENFLNVEPKVRNTASTIFEVDVGSYAIRLTSPGTKDVLFEMPARNFEDRKYYNLGLFNEGSAEVPSAFWMVQDDDAAAEQITNTVTRIRAVNSQANFSNVNVNIGTTRVFTNIPFGGISSFTRTASGSRTVAFSDTVVGATISQLTDTFLPARDYSVFLSPTTGGAPTAFRTLDTNFPPSSGKVRVRLVNASTLADVGLALSFTPTTPNIASRAGSDYFEVNSGTGTPVTITQGAASTPLISSTTDLTAGRTFTFVVSGIPGAIGLAVRQDN